VAPPSVVARAASPAATSHVDVVGHEIAGKSKVKIPPELALCFAHVAPPFVVPITAGDGG
jgi:hypothetical protein